MTIDETIEQLDSVIGTYEILLGNGVNSDILDVDDLEAIKVAIASLEAWERVKDDIHEYETDCLVSADCADCKDCNVVMFKSIYQIIDKHLEVTG